MIRQTTSQQGHNQWTVQWRAGDQVHTRRVATLADAKRLDADTLAHGEQAMSIHRQPKSTPADEV